MIAFPYRIPVKTCGRNEENKKSLSNVVMAKNSFRHAKIIGKTFSRSKIFAWSQSISPQIFGNYKGENGGFIVEGVGRQQFNQVISDVLSV